MVKDKNCPRPGNCEGLCTAKMNNLLESRSLDRKMQTNSVVKAGVFLSKALKKQLSSRQSLQTWIKLRSLTCPK
ncbi:hypothetical protein DPMN_154489 [Dreissena polymorpha]|uniref:Uncharacterized protein n=1 Tax=Dreissena polymorpha TaxID=45954 RepID=A0A9D4FQ16_DREPO|nr:hypothetical protein DPMN_154489 [Dreissena polymorpha]